MELSKSLLHLNLESNNIKDLFFLETFKNITYLNLKDNKIKNFSFIEKLKEIKSLDISDNIVDDFSFLQSFVEIEELDMDSCGISDIKFLSNFKELTHLGLSFNKICDISPLSSLNSLEYLHLCGNNINNVEPLQNLNSLRQLLIHDNNIEDISPLLNLPVVQEITLVNNSIQYLPESINKLGLKLNFHTQYGWRFGNIYLAKNPIKNVPKGINIARLSKENRLHRMFDSFDIQDYIDEDEQNIDISNASKFQTVFISYSTKDKTFANALNDELKKFGVSTFLWEKDAPGGKPLKTIMKINVQNHERLLFIASQNSIKSEACQFEITQGRIRQDIEWKKILFPIHIDNYLFEIEKEEIPLNVQEEYWSNIEGLREINSINFSDIKSIDSKAFKDKVRELLKGLEK